MSTSPKLLRNAVLAAFYLGWTLLLAALWLLALPGIALAYVDPSVMTYTIQAVAGVAVGLSAVAGVLFRRTRKKLFALLNIDENADKAVEGDISRIDADAPDASSQLEAGRTRAEAIRKKSSEAVDGRALDRLPFKRRIWIALIICIYASFTLFFAPPLDIVGANTESLVFGVLDIWWIIAVFSAVIAIALAVIVSLLPRKLFSTVLLIIFCIALAGYVQSLFLNKGMLQADGGWLNWFSWYFISKMLKSLVVWAIIIGVPLYLSRLQNNRSTWVKGAAAVGVLLIVVQAFGVGSVILDAKKDAAELEKPYVTQEGLFALEPSDNVVVFVLDTFDTKILDDMVAADPSTLDEYEDFTWFRDSAGTLIPTFNAVPYLLTGNKPDYGQSLRDYRAHKYEETSFLSDIHDAGWSLGLYSDSMLFDNRNPVDRELMQDTLNIHPVHHAPINELGTFLALEQCGMFRDMPWFIKPLFWYWTSDINNRMIDSSSRTDESNVLYELDDAKFKLLLNSRRVHIEDTDARGAFKFYHLFGSHFPFNLSADGRDVGAFGSDQFTQSVGSLSIVTDYLRQLKELGLYDSTTIIVTADHGVWGASDHPVSKPVSPIMLVKPARPDGSERQPLVVSQMPVSHDDFCPTVLDAIGLDPSGYEGVPIFTVDDPNRVRLYNSTTNVDGPSRFVEYEITGDILDINSWHMTGNEWR